jgi:CRISPR/Cas system CSM-associated protein Csm2 small subunit
MEYMTERLVEQVVEEIATGRIRLLNSHALMKAQAKEYVRNSQVRLILDEVLTRLAQRLGSREAVVARLTEVLAQLREEATQ